MPGKAVVPHQKKTRPSDLRPHVASNGPIDGLADDIDAGSPTLEISMYGAALVVGAALRLILLDARPLSVEEGSLASQAYRVMLGHFDQSLRDGPLQDYGTALFLSLFAAGDWAARLLPALAGTVLVGTPYLLRGSLGRMAALIAAWGFALSPVLLFASRAVGSGVMLAALTVLLWWAVSGSDLKENWRPYALAVLVAGLVTSGPAGLTSILALGLAALLSHPDPGALIADIRAAWRSSRWRRAALALVATAAGISVGIGANLHGLQYLLVDLWTSWLSSINLFSPRGGLLVIVGMYELPVFILALARLLFALVRRERVDTFLSLWAMILLLIGMVQPGIGLPRIVLPLIPLYLLAARSVAGALPAARGATATWNWAAGVVALTVPCVVGMILLNRATVLVEPTPQEFLYGEVALVLCAILVVVLLLDGPGRRAAVWYVVGVASLAFLVHTAAFLNYRLDSSPSELIVGQQISPQLRDAAIRDAYYSTYFSVPLTVDPQLRVPLEWYLRSAGSVDYSTARTDGISIAVADAGQTAVPAGSERIPGLYSPALDGARISWESLWSWAMTRSGLVRPNPRDIILRIPMSAW